MQKIFTKLSLALLLMTTVISLNAQTVLWPSSTDPNQVKASKFTDGMNGWTAVGVASDNPAKIDSALWVWDTAQFFMKKGAYYNAGAPLPALVNFSPSYADGYMCFQSDYYDNRGIQGNFGNGPCPSAHRGDLISPVINLTGKSGFFLAFNQAYRKFTGTRCLVTWSEDGGTTWRDTTEVNAAQAVNALATTEKVLVKLKGSVGTANVRIKIIFDADYYFWSVDDVQILQIGNDLKINTNFYAIPANRFIPKTQVEKIPFLSDMSNVGSNPTTNTRLRANIYNWGKQIYTTETNLGTVPPDAVIENTLVGTPWTPKADTGVYNGSYRVLHNGVDDVLTNDSVSFFLGVTDTTFSKENGRTRSVLPSFASLTAGTPKGWKYGNSYYIAKKGWYRLGTTFGLTNPSTSMKTQLVSTWLYKYNEDGIATDVISTAERTRIASADIVTGTVVGNITYNAALAPFDDDAQKCVQLDTGNYLLMIEHAPTLALLDSMIVSASGLYDYAAMVFATDSISSPRLAPILGGYGTITDDWIPAGFTPGYNIVPVARLHINPTTPRGTTPTNGCKDITSDETPLTDDNKLSVFPNPVAVENLTVNIDLTLNAKTANLGIYDMNGRMIQNRDYDNVKNEKFTLPVSNLANGNYFLKLTTPEGFKAVQFSVQK
jgi:Secretion system C-terminal sorting domain